jgi:CDP-diacylglycerol--glycerol-3-phosphate 3-phosphatidyltransferase
MRRSRSSAAIRWPKRAATCGPTSTPRHDRRPVGDRASDLIVFGGLAWLAAATGGPVALVAAAAAAATLPTFASLAAAGAGATRRNGGPVGKTERCALVVVATAWPAALAVVCGVVVVGSLATAVVRLVAAHRELAR